MIEKELNKFLEAAFDIPVAFGVWEELCDSLYISNALKKLIGCHENIIDPYLFSHSMQKLFGNFLNIAAKKILHTGEYSENHDKFKLILKHNPQTKIYLLLILDNSNESSRNFENIINMIPIYVWQRNRDLNITYCNKRYADALDTSVDNVIKSNIRLPITTPDKGASLEQIALASGKIQKTRSHVIINGTRKYLEFTEVPASTTSPQIGFAIDITDEEKISKEYNIHQKQTAETFNHLSIPIAVFDIDTRLVFTNKAMLMLFDIQETYIASKPYFSEILDLLLDKRKLMEVEDYQSFKKKTIGFFREIISPYHTFMHTPDGRSLNIVISPHYGGGLVFVFEDITEKMILEREFNALSAVQRETLDHLHEGILVFGTDNRLKMTNPALSEMWSKNSSEKFAEMHIKDFFEESIDVFISNDDCQSWISQVVNISSQRIESSGMLNLKTGSNIEYTYVPLPDGLNLIRFVDVTSRLKLEKALIEKTEIVSQIDRLKSSFIANVSYELKSPLNTISGFADILLKQYFGDLNSKQSEYCNGIIIAVNRLSELIEAMLNLATIEAGQMKIQYKEIHLKSFISESVNLFLEAAINRDITINILIPDEDLKIYMDEKSMKQVMFQLISMAIKSTKISGCITISATISDKIPDYVNISIQDMGVGLSTDDLERMRKIVVNDVDERNFCSALEFGIVFANNVVRLHNGRMYINSEKNLGTEITLCIPSKPFFV